MIVNDFYDYETNLNPKFSPLTIGADNENSSENSLPSIQGKREIQVLSNDKTHESYDDDPDFYLDYSVYSDYYNDPEDLLDKTPSNADNVVQFRDFPMEHGYVRMPVFIPNLQVLIFHL